MDILRQQAYATDEMLKLRYHIHETYSVPNVDFRQWVISRLHWSGSERVLDLGCGPGAYVETLAAMVPEVRYMGLDFSAGMLEKHPQRGAITQADSQDLPYAAHSFDVVMANHMLYHLPDIDRALAEIRRVLRPDGVLLAATNSVESMPQFRDLFKRAIMVLTAPGKQIKVPRPASYAFTLESGTRQLSNRFFAVMRQDFPSAFVFDEIEPVMEYLGTMRSLYEPQLPPEVDWDAVMMIVREQVRNQLNYVGQLIVQKLSGVLIASDRGGFIHDYVYISEHPE